MADASESPPTDDLADGAFFAEPTQSIAPRAAYAAALGRYDGALLAMMAQTLGLIEAPAGVRSIAASIDDRLNSPGVADRLVKGLPNGSHVALSLMAATESSEWPVHGMAHALACLGIDARKVLPPLLYLGVIALDDTGTVQGFERPFDPATSTPAVLRAHPSALAAHRTRLPDASALPRVGGVRQPRESDGLEPILRLGAVWQRVAEAPLRQTQQGLIYKRDRERIEDDPVIAGPIADALEPLPDMPALWMTLGRGVGLLESEPGSERITAASPEYWSENAYHLPRMVALRWLGLRTWHEQGGMQREGAVYELALPYVRPAVLLLLATLGADEWVAVPDLAAFLRENNPRWDLPSFLGPAVAPPAPARPTRERAKATRPPKPDDSTTLEAVLLGPAYQLGLIRAAEEATGGRRVVQLTDLGRYLLAVGPPPPARPVFEHFLFVQPSFEVIAYRQGLNPGLIGQFSRFAVWSQISAALAMKLTPESVYRGLEGGLTPQAMLELLAKHNSRPLPAGVAESLRTWADRRERVTYHGSATLVEFATPEELEQALAHWPEGPAPAPVRVSDRLVLVEQEQSIPFSRFRSTGSRDYRRPAEACVEIEPDGVTLGLDLARSDLLVDAELARFSDELSVASSSQSGGSPRRRFAVTAESLARAEESGLTPASLVQWFTRRTGHEIPPAIRLIMAARAARQSPLATARPLVLTTPTAELLDGLAQHPATRDFLGERLGPTTVVIPDALFAAFRAAVERLGLSVNDPSK